MVEISGDETNRAKVRRLVDLESSSYVSTFLQRLFSKGDERDQGFRVALEAAAR